MLLGTYSQLERKSGAGLLRLAAVVSVAATLAACQSSRFDDGGGYRRTAPQRQAAVESDIEPGLGASPAGRVESSPLPPAPGAVIAPDPNMPGVAAPGSTNVAGLSPATTPSATPAAPPPASRSSAIGRWTAKEAAGNCGVTLSSTPSLDLYRASTSGCANKDLQSVNAWEFRDGEVYLYARGGVVARLRDSGGQFSGVIAKSGAPLSLSK